MSSSERYRFELVEFIPEHLEPGVLYVSLTYLSSAHLCMCGCGYEVTTPVSPERWSIIFDGRTVSLWTSIGNWGFDCQSHYWLERGRVDWAPKWSRERIDAGRAATRRRIEGAAQGSYEPRAGHMPAKLSWVRRLWAALRR